MGKIFLPLFSNKCRFKFDTKGEKEKKEETSTSVKRRRHESRREKKREKIFFLAIFESRIHPRRGISGHTLHKIRSLIVARCFYLSTARSTYSVQVTMSRNGSVYRSTNRKKRVLERDDDLLFSACG